MTKEIKLSTEAVNLPFGIYEHYKGYRYQVIGVALHSENLEEMVVYKALYGDGLVWARPLKMFLEDVEIDGEIKPRFRYLE